MESVAAPIHTCDVAPSTTETSHHRLRIAATVCWKLFEKCTRVSPSHLSRNYGKFKVWCGNLGVRQGGHASLDWRLKDDDIMENEVFSMLTDLQDDLQQVLEVLSGTRPPYEQEEPASETSSLSGSSTPGELETRLDAIDATITALYQMSFLVRNQGTRRLASSKAQNYQPRDPDEAALLESFVSFDRQHIEDLFRDLRQPRSDDGQPMGTRPDFRNDGDSQDHILKARCLAASTARRRQLAYWKMHSHKLKSVAAIPETGDLDQNATIYSGTEASGVFKRIESDFAPVEVQSLASVVSTVRDIDGHETEFPGPPERSNDNEPFECPYCFVLCQPEEAGKRRWKKHILEDLRPYICTYPECQDGTQLYGNRREWKAHEDTAHRFLMSPNDDTSKKHVIIDDRRQCLICLLDVADLPGRTVLTKHMASHLERFSLDCLPLNTSSWGDENIQDDETDTSDPDQDLLSQPHEHTVRNELETDIEKWETETKEDSRVEKLVSSDETIRELLEVAMAQEERELITEGQEALDEAMRKRLAEPGFEPQQIDATVKDQEGKQQSTPETFTEQVAATGSLGVLAAALGESEASGQSPTEHGPRYSLREGLSISSWFPKTERADPNQDNAKKDKETEKQQSTPKTPTTAPPQVRPETETHLAESLATHLQDVSNQEPTTSALKAQHAQPAPATTRREESAGVPLRSTAPVYPKVHTDYIATETLRYYDVPWEYDKSDPSYIVILRELDKAETNVLFEFTKRFREGRILLNDYGDHVPKEGDPFPWRKTKSRESGDETGGK